jgi:hypothetical protein
MREAFNLALVSGMSNSEALLSHGTWPMIRLVANGRPQWVASRIAN